MNAVSNSRATKNITRILMMALFTRYRVKKFKSQLVDLPPDFDEKSYLEMYPDVIISGQSASEHFRRHGYREGRLYSKEHAKLLAIPDDFDDNFYLARYPDVANSGQSAKDHYKVFGRIENRLYKSSNLEVSRLPNDFDEQTYLELNPDVLDFDGFPREHYEKYGRKEERNYKIDQNKINLGTMRVGYKSYPSVNSYKSASCFGDRPINPKIIAFYLPQYHQVRENDEWWGEGFTEWTNVRKAKPNFDGHPQPHIPLNYNYYDLSDPTVQQKQTMLARTFGVNAFCYYMYWFNGRRILEKPLDNLLNNKNIESEFCICWANENWTRTWDGQEKDILLQQIHSAESDRQFIKDAMKYLSDQRYMRIDGKLMLLVYRVDLIPNCAQTAAIWREEVRLAGLGELHLCAVQFYGVTDPTPWGFDAAVEFPPHGWLEQKNMPEIPHKILNKDFKGHVFDYKKSINHALDKPIPSYTWYRGVFPGWDNTARRQNTSHIFADSSPELFQFWLTEVLRQQIIMSKPEHQIIFINAWNEWGEGAHLEPDEVSGFKNLEAVSAALTEVKNGNAVLNVLNRLRNDGGYPSRSQDEALLLKMIQGYERTIKYLTDELNNR